MAISANTKLLKRNKINKKYNKNRYEKNFLDLILDKFNKTSIFQNK